MSFAPRRPLGRTGFVATRLGIGDLADRRLPLDECVATLRRALDAGLNVVDTAPNYEQGYSEQIVGRALQGRARDAVFVIDKIDDLHGDVPAQLAASLQRLGLDHVDLLAFHACSTADDFDRLCAPGGGFDQLDGEVAAGRVRFVGLSSHHPEVLRLALAASVGDVLMFPIGPFVDRRYDTEVLPLAQQLGVGTVCFKTFGAGLLLGDTLGYQQPLPAGDGAGKSSEGEPRLSVEECLRYTLTLDPDVALLGLSTPAEQDAAFAAAEQFVPLDGAELAAVRERAAAAIAGKGACWWNPDG